MPGFVSFSDNGDATADDITATFSAAGTYCLYVTVTNANGLSVSSDVTYSVSSVFTSIGIASTSPAPAASGTQPFTATADDQFGNALASQPSFTWNVTGSGYSFSGSTLHAGTTVGNYHVAASSGSITSAPLYYSSAPSVVTGASAIVDVSSTSAMLNATGTDSLGGSDLTYTWTVSSGDADAVSFFDNGDSTAASNTASFSSAGSYTFEVTISNGTQSTTSSVSTTIAQVLTQIEVTPHSAVPGTNATQSFTAIAYDQFGNAMATQPSFGWEVSSPIYSINSSGVLSTHATLGSYGVIATAQGVISPAVPLSQLIAVTSQPSGTVDTSSHTTAALTLTTNDTYGIASYIWSLAGNAPLPVSFSDNDDDSANNMTATFSSAGTYNFVVTITDNNGVVTTASTSVTVGQTLTSIVVNSTSSAPAASGTQQFTAVAYDQFGNAMVSQPSFTWNVTGSGYSFSGSTLHAGTTIGSYDVTASYSGITSPPVYYSSGSPGPTVAVGASGVLDSSSSSALLSVTGADTAGGSDLTYTWTVTGSNAGEVSFSDNADNTAENATAFFASAGSYTFHVSISDGVHTATSSMSISVSQALATIVATPLSASISSAGTQSFMATGYDQFGNVLATQPSFTWSVVGNGNAYSIGSSSGVLSTAATAGSYIVTASSGTVSSEVLEFSQSVSISTTAYASSTNATASQLQVGAGIIVGSGTLTYTWSTSDNSPAGVTFSDNDDSTAYNPTAIFAAAGTYQFMVTVTDDNGDTSTSLTDPLTIGQQLASVQVTPSAPLTGGNQQFTAVAYDQFGNPMITQPTFTWSATGSGYTINSDGLLATSSPSGNYSVSASATISSTTKGASMTLTPAISITTAASATSSDDESFVTLNVMGDDDEGGEDLTYHWTVTSGNADDVFFADNDDNSASGNIAYFDAPGTYQFEVTATDPAGDTVTSTTSSVTISSILNWINVLTSNPVPLSGGTQQFTAIGYDQFDERLATQPSFMWSVTGGGYSISPSGNVTLNALDDPGSYTVTASTSGGIITGSMPQDALPAPGARRARSEHHGVHKTPASAFRWWPPT